MAEWDEQGGTELTELVEEDLLPYLEYQPEEGGELQRVPLSRIPFYIGRATEADHTIHSRHVSTFHAEIDRVGDGFAVRDLGSTNGTYVNNEKVTHSPLRDGDTLHVAEKELRFSCERFSWSGWDATALATTVRHEQGIDDVHRLERILGEQAVSAVFQPIVRLSDGATLAYEALGRNALPGLDWGPGKLFHVAEMRGKAAQLSRLLREVALRDARELPAGQMHLFLNIHPAELEAPGFYESLEELRAGLREGQFAVLEVHEAAITDPKSMMRARERLHEMGLGIAYDDFGAGQSRLRELSEVPPDYLKLDMGLVRDIDRNAVRQDLVRAVCRIMAEQGAQVLAEGVESDVERTTCLQLGCTFGQGFLFGRPAAVSSLPAP